MSNSLWNSGQCSLLNEIKSELAKADRLCGQWGLRDAGEDAEEQERAEAFVQSAFEKSLVLMEMVDLPKTRDRVLEIYEQAKGDLIETKNSVNLCEPYLVWSYRLAQIIEAPEIASSLKTDDSIEQGLPSGMSQLEQLSDAFHRTALKLKKRYAQRAGFVIADEYDVQDLWGALLVSRFADVRPEEWVPSHAGKATRMDVLLKAESIVLETKMIRDGLTDGKVGDELIVDIDHYKKHPDCKALFCFVYDPEHRLKNPVALETDLSSRADELSVLVRVRPKR
jgi:hypothetical protein